LFSLFLALRPLAPLSLCPLALLADKRCGRRSRRLTRDGPRCCLPPRQIKLEARVVW
jgi:hypothetical protein